MNDLLLRLEFESVVRIGAPGRDDQSVQHSVPADQLFSWLSLGWIQLFGKEDFNRQVLQPFCEDRNPWLHTDLFPYVQDTIWLPTPWWHASKTSSVAPVDKKQYKAWVSWDSFFKMLLEDKPLMPDDTKAPVETVMLNNVAIRRDKGEDNAPYYTAAVAGSTSGGTSPRTSFASIVRCAADGVEDKLSKVCQFMGNFGLGGGRSSGLGTIIALSLGPLPKNCAIPEVQPKRGIYGLLSPCCPTKEMLDEVTSSANGSNCYSISARAGWLYDEFGQATNIRKPTVRAFDTGAIFSVRPRGKLVDVGTAQYPAFRYGIPFSIEA